MSRPSAVVISPEAPYPMHGGGTIRTASLLHYLARHYDLDLILFRQEFRKQERLQARGFIIARHYYGTPCGRRPALRTRVGLQFHYGLPFALDKIRREFSAYRRSRGWTLHEQRRVVKVDIKQYR